MRYRSVLVALLAAVPCLSAPAVSAQELTRISATSSYRAPLGFLLFCLESREPCQPQTVQEVALTAELMAQLQSVNASVNRSISPRSERLDVWSVGVSRGDCEDYALTKRAVLSAAGVPTGALRIGVGTLAGEDHAVLVVRTDAGDLVLDNMTDAILPWDRSEMDFTAISGADPMQWFRIG